MICGETPKTRNCASLPADVVLKPPWVTVVPLYFMLASCAPEKQRAVGSDDRIARSSKAHCPGERPSAAGPFDTLNVIWSTPPETTVSTLLPALMSQVNGTVAPGGAAVGGDVGNDRTWIGPGNVVAADAASGTPTSTAKRRAKRFVVFIAYPMAVPAPYTVASRLSVIAGGVSSLSELAAALTVFPRNATLN
jgi:hypothetical protein